MRRESARSRVRAGVLLLSLCCCPATRSFWGCGQAQVLCHHRRRSRRRRRRLLRACVCGLVLRPLSTNHAALLPPGWHASVVVDCVRACVQEYVTSPAEMFYFLDLGATNRVRASRDIGVTDCCACVCCVTCARNMRSVIVGWPRCRCRWRRCCHCCHCLLLLQLLVGFCCAPREWPTGLWKCCLRLLGGLDGTVAATPSVV